MRVFRIAGEKYARDLSGAGAKLSGGRWNRKEHPALYTSTTAALAALEVLVHIDWGLIAGFRLVELEVEGTHIQDLRGFLGIAPTDNLPLPSGWNVSPPPATLALLGEKWLASLASVGLIVPSTHFPNGPDQNLLLNPVHPQFSTAVIIRTDIEFEYDSRLRK